MLTGILRIVLSGENSMSPAPLACSSNDWVAGSTKVIESLLQPGRRGCSEDNLGDWSKVGRDH
jgi:hypothetical protein